MTRRKTPFQNMYQLHGCVLESVPSESELYLELVTVQKGYKLKVLKVPALILERPYTYVTGQSIEPFWPGSVHFGPVPWGRGCLPGLPSVRLVLSPC